jgi:hypothetical protein
MEPARFPGSLSEVFKEMEMNFDEVIQTHAAWKVKLSTNIRKKDGSPKAAEARSNNCCAVGQWL